MVVTASPSFYLDALGGSSENGTPLQIWDCLGAASQQWIFQNGALVSGLDQTKCVDAGPSMDQGFVVMLWECNGYPQQQFDYDEAYLHTIYLTASQDATMCLDIPGGVPYNGNQVWIWECYGGVGQEFAQVK